MTWQTIWELDSTECYGMREWKGPEVYGPGEGGDWIKVPVPQWASTVKLKFVFDAVDNVMNDYLGWLIDDVKIAIAEPEPLSIGPDRLPEGIGGQSYTATLVAKGGAPPYSWRVLSKPDWLDPQGCLTGPRLTLSGTAPEVDETTTYQVCVSVQDSRGNTVDRCYDIIVEASYGVIFQDDFDEEDKGWLPSGLWHRTDGSNWPQVSVKPEPPYASPDFCYYYGKDETLDYDTGSANSGELSSPQIEVSEYQNCELLIGWKYWRQVESYDGEYDKTWVEISWLDSNRDPIFSQTIWYEDSRDPSEEEWILVEQTQDIGGEPIVVPEGATYLQISFHFSTVDGYANDYVGWLIDDVKVLAVICPPPPPEGPQITTTCSDLDQLPEDPNYEAQVGVYYEVTLEVTGGTPPYTWSWDEGDTIPGLTLDPQTGTLSGTPTQAGTYNCTFKVTDANGLYDTLSCTIRVKEGEYICEIFEEDFSDAQAWEASGLWHITNAGCAGQCEQIVEDYAYFGQDETCNYATGGRVQGYLTSPQITIPDGVQNIYVCFDQFRYVEYGYGYGYDETFVEISWDGINWWTIWYEDSGDPSPECDSWVIGPIFVESDTLWIRFGFDSVDGLYNNYPGWAIDNVSVINAACQPPAPPVPPASLSAVGPKAGPREPTFLAVPNPVRDVHTTTFMVRGVEAELIRVEVYDLSGRLVWQGEAPGSRLVWHTEDLVGNYLANGVYLYVIRVKVGDSWIHSGIQKLAIYR
ncbi:MAG TPA: hypothetical protein ENF77_05545 [Candidatus Acetothermia bacterium]|nr:hypothetical protein [Candidatus Acetothermia bacterium]